MNLPDRPLTGSRHGQGTAPSDSGLHVPLPAALSMLHYFCTSLPVLKFLWYTGLCLLPVSLLGYFFSRYFAFGIGIYAYIAMLVLPFMVAVPQQRGMLGTRRLSLVPGFPLATGLVLLAMTVLLAAFIPLLAWLYRIPDINPLLGPRIFVGACLYSVILHYCLVSRHVVLLLSLLPFLFFLVLLRFASPAALLWDSAVFMGLAVLACLAGWTLTLRSLHTRSNFSPPFNQVTSMMLGGYEDNQPFIIPSGWQLRPARIPPGPSLLLGFPAALAGRLLNTGYLVLVSPLLCSLFLVFLWNLDNDEKTAAPPLLQLLFVFHLFMAFTCTWSWGELAARGRLLWLRMGGTRAQLWQYLEGQLWTQYAVLFAYTLALMLTLLLLDQFSLTLRFLVPLTLCASLHHGYLNLLSRLRHWGSWMQAISMIASMLVICAAGGFAIARDDYLPILATSSALLVCAGWSRQQCRRAFASVDWLRLRPLNFKRPVGGKG